jgi:hypothetical protein
MADTLVDLVPTVTLGDTELATGSYTALTAGASTGYVMRDWFMEPNPLIENLTLSINDVDVGIDATLRGTGALIIPPLATLKVISTSFPITYKNLNLAWFDSATSLPWSSKTRYIGDTDSVTDTTKTASQDWTGTPATMTLDNTSIKNEIMYVGSSFYQCSEDNNVTHNTGYWATGGVAKTVLSALSYHPHQMVNNEGVVYFNPASTLNFHTPAGGEVAVRTSVPETAFSSYSRSAIMKRWLFWTKSASFLTSVYAINIDNGAMYSFTSMTSGTSITTNWRMAVAYDTATDKFSIYRIGSGDSTMHRAIPDVTLTTMNAAADDSDNTISTFTETSLVNYATNYGLDEYNENSFAYNNPRGSDTNGDEIYYITETAPYKELMVFDFVATTESVFKTTDYADAGYNYYFEVTTPTIAEVTADNYVTNANFTIRASGIKSVE